VIVREVVRSHHILIRVGEQSLERTEEADQRIRNALDLFQHAVFHFAAVKHLSVSRTCLRIIVYDNAAFELTLAMIWRFARHSEDGAFQSTDTDENSGKTK